MDFNSIESLYNKIVTLGKAYAIDLAKTNFKLDGSKLLYKYENSNGKALIKDFVLEITVTKRNPIFSKGNFYLINFYNTDVHRIFLLKSDTAVVKLLPEFLSIVDEDWYSKILQARCIYENSKEGMK